MNPLLIRRRGMMQARGGGGILPQGYTLLTAVYGLTNGARFVIVPSVNNNVEIEVVAKKGSFTNYSAFFGNYVDENHNSFRLICATNNRTLYANANMRTSSPNSGTVDTVLNWHTYIVKRATGGTYLSINGVSTVGGTATGITNLSSIYLNASSGNAIPSTVETYFSSVIVKSSGTIIRDYYPCIDPNNIVGFYDIVREVFDTSENPSYPFYAVP